MRVLVASILFPILLAGCETDGPAPSQLAAQEAAPVERVTFGMMAIKQPKSLGVRYHALDIVSPTIMPMTIKLDCRIDRATGELGSCAVADENDYSNPAVAARRVIQGMRIELTEAMRTGAGELRTDIDVPLTLEGRPALPPAPASMLSPQQVNWERAPGPETMRRIESMLNRLIGKQTKITIACQVQVDHSLACHPPVGDPPLQEIGYRDLYPLAADTQVAAALPDGPPSAGAWLAFRFDMIPTIVVAPPARSVADKPTAEQRVPLDTLAIVKPRSIGARHHALDIVLSEPLPQTFLLDCEINRITGVASSCRVGKDGVGGSSAQTAARRRALGTRFDVSALDLKDLRPLRTDIPVTLSVGDRIKLPAPPSQLLKAADISWVSEPDAMQAGFIDSALHSVEAPVDAIFACQIQADHSLVCLDIRTEPSSVKMNNGAAYWIADGYEAPPSLPTGVPSAGAWIEFRYSRVPTVLIGPPRN